MKTMTTLWFRPTPHRRGDKITCDCGIGVISVEQARSPDYVCCPHYTMEAIIEFLCPMNLYDPDLLVFNLDSPPNCPDEEYQQLLQNASGQIAGIIMTLTGSTCVVQGQFAQPLSPREITTINNRWNNGDRKVLKCSVY